MSAYSVTVPNGGTFTKLSLTPVTYEVRVQQVAFAYSASISASTASVAATVQYYSGGATGGSSAAITPMRAGSPAATATAKSAYTGGSGTLYTVQSFAAAGNDTVSGSFQFQPPYDFILTPGSSLACTFTVNVGTSVLVYVTAYFEELLLSWHQ